MGQQTVTAECVKCSEWLEWEKINGALAELRTHIVRKYISDSLQRRIGPSWLRDAARTDLRFFTADTLSELWSFFLFAVTK